MTSFLVQQQTEARCNSTGVAVVIRILNEFKEEMGRGLTELVREAAANLA